MTRERLRSEDLESPYCEICGCCAELPCCGIDKFLKKHGLDCKYYEIYKKEILENKRKIEEIENAIYSSFETGDCPLDVVCEILGIHKNE